VAGDDQREASGRPDVLTFVTDVLSAPMKISGQPIANLVASRRPERTRTGVVKLIDVYPDEVAGQPEMVDSVHDLRDIFAGAIATKPGDAKQSRLGNRLLYRLPCPQRITCFYRDIA